MRRAGVQVTTGILEKECRALNPGFEKWITRQLPYVVLKAGLSLDGKIATAGGSSQWITNEKSCRYVHEWRNRSDAILVGGETFRQDDPRLTVRLGKKNGRQPIAVIVDHSLRWPKGQRVFQAKERRVIVVTGKKISSKTKEALAKKGVDVWRLPAQGQGRVRMLDLMRSLAQVGITSVFVEGGGSIYSQLLESKLVDKVVACIAPKILGGKGKDWFPTFEVKNVNNALKLSNVIFKQFGDNVVIEGDF